MRDFTELVLEIDAKKYVGGILSKMDAVLRLRKKGYGAEQVVAGLEFIARKIPNDRCRNIAIDVYTRRVR